MPHDHLRLIDQYDQQMGLTHKCSDSVDNVGATNKSSQSDQMTESTVQMGLLHGQANTKAKKIQAVMSPKTKPRKYL